MVFSFRSFNFQHNPHWRFNNRWLQGRLGGDYDSKHSARVSYSTERPYYYIKKVEFCDHCFYVIASVAAVAS